MSVASPQAPGGGIKPEKLPSIEGQGASRLKWPNSVCVFEDGRIAVADGGNNRVIVMDQDAKTLWEHGGKGFEPSNLREPIFVAVSPDQYLFVSDWHNHRVLVFTPDLEFSHTLFHLGPLNPKFLFTMELFIKHLLTDAVGAPYYFTYEKMKGEQNKKADYKLSMFLKGLFYYFKNLDKAFEIFRDCKMAVRKVNGIVFDGDQLVITQKANRCVSAYKIQGQGYKTLKLKQHLTQYPGGKHLGRLCNMSIGPSGRYFVCDQNNWAVCVLDKNLGFEQVVEYEQRDDLPMAPFSCVEIAPDIIAAARSFGIEIRNIKNGKILWECNDLGETHGIAWDQNAQILYYVDRSNSLIQPFKVEL